MKILITLSLVALVIFTSNSQVQPQNYFDRHIEFMESRTADDYHIPIPMCMQSERPINYPATKAHTPPENLEVHISSIHSAYASFESTATDVDYFVYAIGSTPGASDIKYWQLLSPNNRKTNCSSMATLGIAEGTPMYFSVYTLFTDASHSDTVISDMVSFNWEDLGAATNTFTIDFADYGLDVSGNIIAGFTPAQIDEMTQFSNRMIPIIYEIYGPPALSTNLTVVLDMYYSSSNIYFPGTNEFHKDTTFNPQLFTHELIHAFHDDVIFCVDEYWYYHPKLTGFEEGFAQAVSYACMLRYAELYPTDPIVVNSNIWGSTYDWDYDYHNKSYLTTEDYWSSMNGTQIHWERYEVGAAACRKMQLEDPDFYKKINAEYYLRMNNDHNITPDRDLLIDIFQTVLPTVERRNTTDWLNDQRIFDCEIVTGHKVYPHIQHYPWWGNYWIFGTAYYYETFTNGSEWAIWDGGLGDYIYYSSNGSSGTGVLRDHEGNSIETRPLQITPLDNPPTLMDIGEQIIRFTTAADVGAWPGGDPANAYFNLNDLGLYTYELDFYGVTDMVYMVIGDEMDDVAGVYGGVKNAQGGKIYIDHADYSPEAELNVTNKAFVGERAWASVYNAVTGYEDSQPGRIGVFYIDSLCNKYVTFRNSDWGSTSGNQLYLFDVNDMTSVTESASFTHSVDAYEATFNNNSVTFTDSVYNFLANDPEYYWDFGDGNTSTDENPVHTYADTGTYNVCLTVTNDCWDETVCEDVVINMVGMDVVNNDGIMIYPNPAKDIIYIDKSNEKMDLVKIYSTDGKLIDEINLKGLNYIDMSEYEYGVYYIKVISSESHEFTQKITLIK